jgi:hypothetical protein
VKVRYKKKQLRFGDWVARIYDVYGERNAPRIVQLAVQAHAVTFRAQQRFVIFN